MYEGDRGVWITITKNWIGEKMIGCIISFIIGGFAWALVMALCAASKNSNVNISLEDTNGNIVANGDVNIGRGQEEEECAIV